MNKNIKLKLDATYYVAIGFDNCVIVELTEENIELYKNDMDLFADTMYEEYNLNSQCSWDVIKGTNFNQY